MKKHIKVAKQLTNEQIDTVYSIFQQQKKLSASWGHYRIRMQKAPTSIYCDTNVTIFIAQNPSIRTPKGNEKEDRTIKLLGSFPLQTENFQQHTTKNRAYLSKILLVNFKGKYRRQHEDKQQETIEKITRKPALSRGLEVLSYIPSLITQKAFLLPPAKTFLSSLMVPTTSPNHLLAVPLLTCLPC